MRNRLRITETKLAEAQRTLDAFSNSEFWRITKPLRLVLDGIKYLLKPILPNKRSKVTEYSRWIRLYDTLSTKQKNKIKAGIKRMTSPAMISVLMPTYNTPPNFLKEAMESVKNQLYPHWELCIADDASTQPHVREILNEYAKGDARIKVNYRRTNGYISEAGNSALALASRDKKALKYFQELAEKPNVTVLRDDAPFNYSHLNNMAVATCGGEIVCLLNNDTEVITSGWLNEMVSHAIRPGIGAVGARLWYPDNTLQHGGVVLGIGVLADHIHTGLRRDNGGYFGRAWLIQNLSAVTGACLVIKKSTYLQVGGLNEQNLPVSFNDVDFCIRVRDAGYRNLWTPFSELYHHESATRGSDTDTPQKMKRARKEMEYMLDTYGATLTRDPAYNPNLSLSLDSLFGLAFPPRTKERSFRSEQQCPT